MDITSLFTQNPTLRDLRNPDLIGKYIEYTQISLRDNSVFVYFYPTFDVDKDEVNILPWSKVADITFGGIEARFMTKNSLVIEASRIVGKWLGWRNRYSIDNASIVKIFLDLSIIVSSTRIYIGNHTRDDGEFIGTAASVITRTSIPQKLILYHGTSSIRANEILRVGLTPQIIDQRVWNKSKNAPSHRSSCVYLTSRVETAKYYAVKAVNVDKKRFSRSYLYSLKEKIYKLERKSIQFPDFDDLVNVKQVFSYYENLYIQNNNRKITSCILRIDLTSADRQKLLVDDDYLLSKPPEMSDDAMSSLSYFSQVAYQGIILPSKIKIIKST